MRKRITRDNFWDYVDRSAGPDACWPWMRSRLPYGYGRFSYEGRSTYAHRVVVLLTQGSIPDGLVVCHRCDNPPCCNPAHLFVGTYQENVHDAIRKGRFVGGHTVLQKDLPKVRKPRPEQKGKLLLTDAQALDILSKHANGASVRGLARLFKVHQKTIYRIVKGLRYQHIPEVAALAALEVQP